MKQTKDTSVLEEIKKNFNPEYFKYYFDKLKSEGLDKEEQRKIELSIIDKAVAHYEKKLGLNTKTARAAVMDLVYLTNEPVDVEKTLEKLLVAVRTILPKLHGLEDREKDQLEAMLQLKKQYGLYEMRIAELEHKLETQEKVFQEAIQAITSNPPTLWNVIKWTWNSLLSSLQLKKRS